MVGIGGREARPGRARGADWSGLSRSEHQAVAQLSSSCSARLGSALLCSALLCAVQNSLAHSLTPSLPRSVTAHEEHPFLKAPLQAPPSGPPPHRPPGSAHQQLGEEPRGAPPSPLPLLLLLFLRPVLVSRPLLQLFFTSMKMINEKKEFGFGELLLFLVYLYEANVFFRRGGGKKKAGKSFTQFILFLKFHFCLKTYMNYYTRQFLKINCLWVIF